MAAGYERWILRGGARHECIGVNVDDFTTLDGNAIPGGELDYDATLFNLGAVYNLTNTVNVYADFSQGAFPWPTLAWYFAAPRWCSL